MKRKNFPGRREQRRLEAEARQDKYDKLSPELKLAQAGPKQRKRLLGK
jgi:hypothetical protein